MRIAVIGAGNVGGGFSRAAVAAGHDVVISAAHPEKAQALASRVGAQAAFEPSLDLDKPAERGDESVVAGRGGGHERKLPRQ